MSNLLGLGFVNLQNVDRVVRVDLQNFQIGPSDLGRLGRVITACRRGRMVGIAISEGGSTWIVYLRRERHEEVNAIARAQIAADSAILGDTDRDAAPSGRIGGECLLRLKDRYARGVSLAEEVRGDWGASGDRDDGELPYDVIWITRYGRQYGAIGNTLGGDLIGRDQAPRWDRLCGHNHVAHGNCRLRRRVARKDQVHARGRHDGQHKAYKDDQSASPSVVRVLGSHAPLVTVSALS